MADNKMIPASVNPVDQLRRQRNEALARIADIEGIVEQAFGYIKVLEEREAAAAAKIKELELNAREVS